MSMVVIVTFFQRARSTIRAASGSNHQLNSRRASMAPGSIAPLSAYRPPPIMTNSLASVANLGVELQCQCIVGERAARPENHLARIFVHHLYNEFRGSASSRLNVRRAFFHRWDDIGR